MKLYRCQDCQTLWRATSLLPVRDVLERVAPGEPMPAGECPRCGAVAHEAPRYTLDAGRCIVRDGLPIATLHKVLRPGTSYTTGLYTMDATEMDALARAVVDALNAHAK